MRSNWREGKEIVEKRGRRKKREESSRGTLFSFSSFSSFFQLDPRDRGGKMDRDSIPLWGIVGMAGSDNRSNGSRIERG